MSKHIISNGDLPENNQYVLVRLTKDNWGDQDDPNGNRYYRVVKFKLGLTLEARKQLPDHHHSKDTYGSSDEGFNNTCGYCWDEFGPSKFFGQEVDIWYDLPVEGK